MRSVIALSLLEIYKFQFFKLRGHDLLQHQDAVYGQKQVVEPARELILAPAHQPEGESATAETEQDLLPQAAVVTISVPSQKDLVHVLITVLDGVPFMQQPSLPEAPLKPVPTTSI